MLRRLPALDRLLSDPALADVITLYGRAIVTVQARDELERLRQQVLASNRPAAELDVETFEHRLADLPRRIARAVERELGGLRRVINATGIFVHTNLGRAPLPAEVMAEIAPLLAGYCDLEMSLESGRRAERNRRLGPLLQALCGAPSALITNNNAAALVLALSTLAKGREVIVSRGELVEIGGSFRIPDILEASGARLVEVGTTNRTRAEDYRRAVGPETALLLKVHPSNYRIVGFTEETSVAALASLARQEEVPLLVDEGSGLLVDEERPQLRDHQSLRALLAAGASLVCGSGDKVLGGPQAGLLLGESALVERCRRHPLYRAMRPDGFTYSALEAVLRRRLAGREMPMDRLWRDPGDRLEKLAGRLERAGLRVEVVEADAFLGGGAAAERAIPGRALAVHAGENLFAALRRGRPAVLGYMREDRLLLDLRTVDAADDATLAASVEEAARKIAEKATTEEAAEKAVEKAVGKDLEARRVG